jgi:dTDP-4-amino-4,6-dideoxygalactose transaminase
MTDMRYLIPIAQKYRLHVVEDACQSILGAIEGKNAGTWGNSGAFSLHPLKNLNVWSDGGVIVTNDDSMNEQLRLLRNHGLSDRDTVTVMGFNSRLDTIQAIVGNWLIPQTQKIAEKRIENAKFYDQALSKIQQITIPPRPNNFKIVYHLYIVFAEDRDELLDFCISNGIEAKIHYPIPIYRQPAIESLGHKYGDFEVTDSHAKKIISFPCDQHLSIEEMNFVVETVRRFYNQNTKRT